MSVEDGRILGIGYHMKENTEQPKTSPPPQSPLTSSVESRRLSLIYKHINLILVIYMYIYVFKQQYFPFQRYKRIKCARHASTYETLKPFMFSPARTSTNVVLNIERQLS